MIFASVQDPWESYDRAVARPVVPESEWYGAVMLLIVACFLWWICREPKIKK